MAKHQPLNISCAIAGNLVTRPSYEIVGINNFVTKRDWRRVLDQEVQREGYDYFWPNVNGALAISPGQQPFPLESDDDGPITLIHECERENGQRALLVGTPSRLYRFYASDDGVFVDDVGDGGGGVFVDDVGDGGGGVFTDDTEAIWKVIGSGFAGYRWEAHNIRNVTFLNNGVDLPVTYELGETEVEPVYELRELGYASFGTSAEYKNITMLGDVSEIQEDAFDDLFRPTGIFLSDNILGSQTAFAITSNESFFTSWMVGVASNTYWIGRSLVFDGGVESLIAGWTSATAVTAAAAATVASPGQRFTVRVSASQTGSTAPAATASIPSGSHTVTATAAVFTAGMVGKYVRLANGWMSRISAIVGAPPSTQCTVADDPAPDSFAALPFRIVSDVQPGFRTAPPALDWTDYRVTATAPIFEAGMEGLELSWDDGTTRTIYSVVDNTHVIVDSDLPVSTGYFTIEREDTYALYNDPSYINRHQYRVAWGVPEDPRDYAAVWYGSIDGGANVLVLDYPVKSLENGTEIQITGAGLNGGNLTATALYVASNRVVILDQFASETVTSTPIQKSSSIGSMAGYDDPPGDVSGIVRMKELGGYCIIYKTKSLIIASYTGDVTAPFAWVHKGLAGDALYYKWTLCQPYGADYHFYAGHNAFYRFDLTAQRPQFMESAQACWNTFFDVAKVADGDDLFSTDNQLTKEIFIVFGGTTDKALAWSYEHNNWSTTAIDISAGATVGLPQSGLVYGSIPYWFIMAIDGVLVTYGLANEPVAAWSPIVATPTVKSIFYRRDYDYYPAGTISSNKKYGYACTLQSGMEHFKTPHSEKHIREVVLNLATQTTTGRLDWSLLKARNAAETPSVEFTRQMPDARTGSLIPTHSMAHLLGYKIVIPATLTGGSQNIGNQVRLVGHVFDVLGVNSASWTKQA